MAALTPFLTVDYLPVTNLESSLFIGKLKYLDSIPEVIMRRADFNLALNISMLLTETDSAVHSLIAYGIPFDYFLDIASAYAAMH